MVHGGAKSSMKRPLASEIAGRLLSDLDHLHLSSYTFYIPTWRPSQFL